MLRDEKDMRQSITSTGAMNGEKRDKSNDNVHLFQGIYEL